MSFYKEVPGRQTTLESTLKFDTAPTEGSTNPVTSDGVASGISQSMRDFEEVMYADQEIPASTLRFSFGDLNYDPTQDTTVASKHNTAERAGGGTPAGYGGTWKKLRTKYTNIWDYTYVDNTLLNEFDNGNYAYEATPATRFWNDVEHNPIKIIASNTTGCANMKRAFQGIHALVEVWELDTSAATDVALLFSSCHNLRMVPDSFNLTSLTSAPHSMFQYDWNLEHIGELVLPDSDSLSFVIQNICKGCLKLKSIDRPLNLKCCTSLFSAFALCIELHHLILENTNRITRFEAAFSCCGKLPLSALDSIDTSNATNFSQMLDAGARIISGGVVILEVPVQKMSYTDIIEYDYSNATDIHGMYENNVNLKTITASKLVNLKTGCNIQRLFWDCHNVESGILDAYNMLLSKSPSTHADVFLNCGINTPTGRAELEQIPASWGGLAEG